MLRLGVPQLFPGATLLGPECFILPSPFFSSGGRAASRALILSTFSSPAVFAAVVAVVAALVQLAIFQGMARAFPVTGPSPLARPRALL